VRGWRLFLVCQFYAIGLRPANHELLFFNRELVERREIMRSAHREDMTTSFSGLTSSNKRNCGCMEWLRVCRAVHEAGFIATVAVGESCLLGRNLGHVCDG
jgi:hypothetical protein